MKSRYHLLAGDELLVTATETMQITIDAKGDVNPTLRRAVEYRDAKLQQQHEHIDELTEALEGRVEASADAIIDRLIERLR